jgi:hypothetical protein
MVPRNLHRCTVLCFASIDKLKRDYGVEGRDRVTVAADKKSAGDRMILCSDK